MAEIDGRKPFVTPVGPQIRAQNGGVDLDHPPPTRDDSADVIINLPSQVDTGPRGKTAC